MKFFNVLRQLHGKSSYELEYLDRNGKTVAKDTLSNFKGQEPVSGQWRLPLNESEKMFLRKFQEYGDKNMHCDGNNNIVIAINLSFIYGAQVPSPTALSTSSQESCYSSATASSSITCGPSSVTTPIADETIFCINDLIDNINLALRRLQSRHPLLQAVLQKKSKGEYYFMKGENFPVAQLHNAFENLDASDFNSLTLDKAIENEMALGFRLNQLLYRIVFYQQTKNYSVTGGFKNFDLSKPIQLLFVFHHAMSDGGSIFSFIKELVTLVDCYNQLSLQFPNTPQIRKEISKFECDHIPLAPIEIFERKFHMWHLNMMKSLSRVAKKILKASQTKPDATFPVKEQIPNRLLSHRRRVALDEESTKCLIRKCKENGIRPSHFINSCISLALVDYFAKVQFANKPIKKRKTWIKHVSINVSIDLRKNGTINFPKEQIKFASSAVVLTLPILVSSDPSQILLINNIWSLAKQCQQKIETMISLEHEDLLFSQLFGIGNRILGDLFAKPCPLPLLFGNFGNIDALQGQTIFAEVYDTNYCSHGTHNQVSMFSYTSNNKLILTASYNNVMKEEPVQGFFDNWVQLISQLAHDAKMEYTFSSAANKNVSTA